MQKTGSTDAGLGGDSALSLHVWAELTEKTKSSSVCASVWILLLHSSSIRFYLHRQEWCKFTFMVENWWHFRDIILIQVDQLSTFNPTLLFTFSHVVDAFIHGDYFPEHYKNALDLFGKSRFITVKTCSYSHYKYSTSSTNDFVLVSRIIFQINYTLKTYCTPVCCAINNYMWDTACYFLQLWLFVSLSPSAFHCNSNNLY